MTLKFSKYQASGNDFIMIDNRNDEMYLNREHIQWLCERHFSIGADGIVFLHETKIRDCAFEMKFYNPDGSSGMFCGNGGRCIVAFARDMDLILEDCCFVAPDGKHRARIQNNMVNISIREPSQPKQFADGWFIDTGTQHFVKFVEKVDLIDINQEGRAIRFESRFSKYGGTNVSFVQKISEGIKVRTYERGVEAETLSCGTAVTAAAIIHSVVNDLSSDIVLKTSTKGGDLQVFLHREGSKISNVYLEGTALKVFSGEIKELYSQFKPC